MTHRKKQRQRERRKQNEDRRLSLYDTKDLYEGEILSLSERWRRVIDSDGAYIMES